MSEQAVGKLKEKLGNCMNLHKARLDFLSRYILGIIKSRNVSSGKVALAYPSRAKLESKQRRIERFYSSYELELETVAQGRNSWLPKGKWILAIDRTNWEH